MRFHFSHDRGSLCSQSFFGITFQNFPGVSDVFLLSVEVPTPYEAVLQM